MVCVFKHRMSSSEETDAGKGPRWWAFEPWWRDPQYLNHGNVTSEDLEHSVANMMKHFDAGWWHKMVEKRAHNVVLTRICGRGLMPLDFIHHLGRTLKILESSDGF